VLLPTHVSNAAYMCQMRPTTCVKRGLYMCQMRPVTCVKCGLLLVSNAACYMCQMRPVTCVIRGLLHVSNAACYMCLMRPTTYRIASSFYYRVHVIWLLAYSLHLFTTLSHHHTYYVTSSYILCHIIIHTYCTFLLPYLPLVLLPVFDFYTW
jgi:hypothetical protein